MLSTKIKTLRKQAKLSQEQLAEKLNVSRQAVTKWETGTGTPDIGNLKSIAALFRVSVDTLLETEYTAADKQDFLFDSITEYDIDCEKMYDVTFMGAKQIAISAYEGEKLQIRLASNEISDIQKTFKTKIDDVKKKVDVDIRRAENISETKAKESLFVYIRFPLHYNRRIELSGNTEILEIHEIKAQNIEFSGKVSHVLLRSADCHLELDSSTDMTLVCETLPQRLDLNQISATSKLIIPTGTAFSTVTRGFFNKILYEQDGESAENFSIQEDMESCCRIELNGVKSELIINAVSTII